jgi:1-acyl-sn-glycerol-3-phosphate acyltransferase
MITRDRLEWLAYITRVVLSGVLISAVSLAIVPVAVVTLFAARRLYAAITTYLARAILRLWGLRMWVDQSAPFPRTQTVYVSNHSSTIDLFALVALGLPNTRFFLSGFLQKFIPLAILARLMGTFFTVPQDRPDERRRIFAAAARTLRRTRESVYLSPEGGRITTGQIGAFNKGAFHMATSLRAPIVPLYFHIPREMDPGAGYRASPGTFEVYVKPAIDTSEWTVENLLAQRDGVRRLFVEWHEQARTRSQDADSPAAAAAPVPALAK